MADTIVATMDAEVSESLDKRLEKNNMLLEKMVKEQTGPYATLREAKAYTETGHGMREKFREAKIARLERAVESERGISNLGANVGAAISGGSAGIKQGAGMLQSDKFFSKQGMKSMAGVGLEGMMHVAGAASGNPLFNLVASGLGSRRKRIQEARQEVVDYEESSKGESKESDPIGFMAEKSAETSEAMAETTAMTKESEEHIALIKENTEYANQLLEEMAMAAMLEQEAREDKDLDEKSIVKATSPAAKASAQTDAIAKKEEEKDADFGMMDVFAGNMMSNMLTKMGPMLAGVIPTLLTTVLPVVLTALAALKLGDWINDTFLTNEDGSSKIVEGVAGASEEFKSEFNAEKANELYKKGLQGQTTQEVQGSITEIDKQIAAAQKASGWWTSMDEQAEIDDLKYKRSQLQMRQAKLRNGEKSGLPTAEASAPAISAPEAPVAQMGSAFDNLPPEQKMRAQELANKGASNWTPEEEMEWSNLQRQAVFSPKPGQAPPAESAIPPIPTPTPVANRAGAAQAAYPNSVAAQAATVEGQRAAAAAKTAQPVIIQGGGGESMKGTNQTGPDSSPAVVTTKDGDNFGNKLFSAYDF